MEIEELKQLLNELRTKKIIIQKSRSEDREEKLEIVNNEINFIRKEYTRILLEQKQKEEGEKKR